MNKALYVSFVEAGSVNPRNIRVGGGQYVLVVGVYCDYPTGPYHVKGGEEFGQA